MTSGSSANAVRLVSEHAFGAGGLRARLFQLENGLRVLLLRDPAAPVFAYQTWFRVGSRHERQGTAFVLPNAALDLIAATQENFEEAFRLDRRSPFYTTHPINVGALIQGDRGTDPAPRYAAHLLAVNAGRPGKAAFVDDAGTLSYFYEPLYAPCGQDKAAQ